MMVSQTKQRRRKKAKLNTKGFKKVFSFKQQDQQHRLHPHPESPSSPTKPDAAVATSTHKNKRRRKQPMAADDNDSTVCSATIDKEGVLIFPMVQRLTSSSPPITILDGIHEQQRGDNFFMDLSLGRRRSNRLSSKNFARSLSSSSRSSAPPTFQHRSPHQSKKDQKNLPATLKSCRRSNSSKADTMNHSSAWERLDSTTSRPVDPSFTTSFGTSFGYSMADDMNDDDDKMCAVGQIDESLLPPEVSPANKFIPIGYEDDDDDISFASADYDICTQQMSADENDQPAAAPVVVAMKKETVKSEAANQPEDTKAACTTDQDKYLLPDDCIDKYSSPHDLPPSPVPTDGTSIASTCYFGTGGEKEVSPVEPHCRMDKYCVALDSQDDNGWFPNVKQEMMKLSALFTSDCSAPSL